MTRIVVEKPGKLRLVLTLYLYSIYSVSLLKYITAVIFFFMSKTEHRFDFYYVLQFIYSPQDLIFSHLEE